MFKTVANATWAFDLEWVPDVAAGRRVYGLPDSLPDDEVLQEMWKRGGATAEDPRPYLKTVLCRIVSVAAVSRSKDRSGAVTIELRSLPPNPDEPGTEKAIVASFLKAVGREKPQLVGFNSVEADLPILLQRGIANGVTAPEFCRRPDKPWEGVDYFQRYSEWHIDLREVVGGWGKATPSLHELAQVSGIPGKMETDGKGVIDLWTAGRLREIVEYNQFDALTTYLVWLRAAHFAGFFSAADYEAEQERVRALLRMRAERGESHLARYLQRWGELQQAVGSVASCSAGPAPG